MIDGPSRAFRAGALLLALMALTQLSACRVSEVLDAELAANTSIAPPEEDTAAVNLETVRAADPEAKLGAAKHRQVIAQNGGVYSNAKLENLLTVITGKLLAADPGPTQSPGISRAYEVTILDSPSVNAFALPGGYLYITRGLLALANDTSEIAAVLAHEMAHVNASHGVARSNAARSEELVETVLAEVVTSPLAEQIAANAVRQKQASFNQRQELQADALGIRRLADAGFDPFAAARFLEALDRFTIWNSGASDQGGMSSTHPSTPRRIELARRHARGFGPEAKGNRERGRYLAAADGMMFGDGASQGFIRGNTFAHKKLGIAFDVPDGYRLENRTDVVLGSGPGGRALRFDSEKERGDVATYLASGWVNGLDPSSIERLQINGLDAATGTAVAGDWRFHVTAIALKGRMYRFILALPRNGSQPSASDQAIGQTFRQLSRREIARLKPLRITVKTVGNRDTVARLAARMKSVARPEVLFRALNGLTTAEEIVPGQKVKLVEG